MESVNSNTVLTVGQNLDVKDSVNKWVNAEVLRVNSYEIYVHYSGWAQRYDEPIPIDSPRILVQWQPGKDIQLNNRVDAYHPLGSWLEAIVIDKTEAYDPVVNRVVCNKVKVHFVRFHPRYDLWLQPHNNNQLAVIGSRSKAHGTGKCRLKNKIPSLTLSEWANKILLEKMKEMVQQLEEKDLVIREIKGDGNCLFRAVSHQLYGSEEHYAEIRAVCMRYITSEKLFFQDFVVEEINEYVARKSRDGQWGDDVEIEALSEVYSRPIQIYATSAEPVRTFHEDNQHNVQPLRLAYVGRSHYNSIKVSSRMDQGILLTPFGEYEQLFFLGYQNEENQAYLPQHRRTFANSNSLDHAIEERAEAEIKWNEHKHINWAELENEQLHKMLQLSQADAIEELQVKQLQRSYEQGLLNEDLKRIEDKQIEIAKEISKPAYRPQFERPYWFSDLLAHGYAQSQIWFAIDVKGYDPDAVQNFLLDNLCI